MINRALDESVRGFLVLEFAMFGEHGIMCTNGSSSFAFVEMQAAIEQALPIDNRPVWSRSWVAEWEGKKKELATSYTAFNLTASQVIAYVQVDSYCMDVYNRQAVLDKLGVEVLTKKHLSRFLLEKWLKNEAWTRFQFNNYKGW